MTFVSSLLLTRYPDNSLFIKFEMAAMVYAANEAHNRNWEDTFISCMHWKIKMAYLQIIIINSSEAASG